MKPKSKVLDIFCAFCRRALGSYALADERLICTGCIVQVLSVPKR